MEKTKIAIVHYLIDCVSIQCSENSTDALLLSMSSSQSQSVNLNRNLPVYLCDKSIKGRVFELVTREILKNDPGGYIHPNYLHFSICADDASRICNETILIRECHSKTRLGFICRSSTHKGPHSSLHVHPSRLTSFFVK